MDIITELVRAPKEYFLSINSDENTLVCGGYDGSNFYGLIEIEIFPEKIIINKTASDGYANSSLQAPDEYSNLMPTYQMAVKLKQDVEEWAKDPEFIDWQDFNRRNLMLNTSKILPYAKIH